MTPTKRRYRAKVKRLTVELYLNDQDIKDRLAERREAGESTATYIKRLIRQDIERDKIKWPYYYPKGIM